MAERAPTYEEATTCPKCDVPGEVVSILAVSNRELRPGTTAHMVFCRNEPCRWFNTSWVVQVNPDGTVPPPNYSKGQAKAFPASTLANADEGERVVRSIERQLAAETQAGAEVRNPHSRG